MRARLLAAAVVATIVTIITAACGGRAAAPAAGSTLQVHDAWARAADSGTVTAVYLAIANHDASPVSLTGASSTLAESVTLHETMAMNGMVHMMPLDSAQTIASGDSLVLAEGAKHLMVTGLRRALVAGDSLPIVLTFAGGRTLTLTAIVKALVPASVPAP